ncbi:MAG: hypothetical protein WDN69_07040 [Aliidongia sp.]
MTVRFHETLRALIASYDRIAHDIAYGKIYRIGELYIWTREIDAPIPVKTISRLLKLVEDGNADARQTSDNRFRWRPTPLGRANLADMDREIRNNLARKP